MKKIALLSILILILFLFSASKGFSQVQVRVKIIQASNVGSSIDSSLSDERGQLGSLFSFSSYRLLREETLNLFPNQPVSILVHPGRSMDLNLIRQGRRVVEVRVKIKREGEDILDTQVRLSPGRTVSIGGPKHGEGTIILTLSAIF